MEHHDANQAWEAFADTGRIGEYLLYAAIRRSENGKECAD